MTKAVAEMTWTSGLAAGALMVTVISSPASSFLSISGGLAEDAIKDRWLVRDLMNSQCVCTGDFALTNGRG